MVAAITKASQQPQAPFRPKAPERCQWFALCERPATSTTKHSVLGDVPTCDRCSRTITEPLTDAEVREAARLLWRSALNRSFDECTPQQQKGAVRIVNALWAKLDCAHTPDALKVFMAWMGDESLLDALRDREDRGS